MRALAALLLGAAIAAPASAQDGTAPASALENKPHRMISNGILTAKVFPPGPDGLYQGTRFDHAGVVVHLTYKGQDYSSWWFDRYVLDPRDTTSRKGIVLQAACCAVAGPVEEFAAVGFDEAGPCREAAQKKSCGRFLKPGIGIFRRDNDDPLKFPTLPALNDGKRGFKATANGAHFTHDIDDPQSGYGYHYEKRVELVAGKPRMVMSHVLKNTGTKTIVTTVYNHNFLSFSPRNAHIELTAPFVLKNDKPLQPHLTTVEGKTLRYLAPLQDGETVTSPFAGFGPSASDYDFTVRNTATGFGQRMRADQPLVRINMWSVPTSFSWEPYIAISVKPGETQRWTYTYDLFGPGEAVPQ